MKATELIVIDESKVFIKLITTALLENRLDSYQFKAESIYTAQTAKEALELLDLHPRVDLIILDATIAALNPNDLLDSLTDPQSCSLIEVILTTTKGKMPKLTNQTKKHILGIIEKPFTMEVFLQKVQDFFQLKEQEKVQEMLLEKEVKLQFQRALKIIGKYLKDESINYDETELKTLCRQYFCGDSTIEKDEFISLISIIIHEFYELKSIKTPVNDAAITLILKPQQNYKKKDPFQMEKSFLECIAYIDPLTLNEKEVEPTLIQLFNDFTAQIAKIYKDVSHFRPKPFSLFYPHFSFIIKELRHIDRTFFDYNLQKEIAHYDEIIKMQKYFSKLLIEKELLQLICELKASSKLYERLHKHIEHFVKLLNTIINNYTALIDLRIWSNAKNSKVILRHLAKVLPATSINAKNFLIYKKKLTSSQAKKFDPYYKELVLVLSEDLEEQKKFQFIQGKYFSHWEFISLAKVSLIDKWLQANRPTKLVVDYDFKTLGAQNGIEFLRSMRTRFPFLKTVLKLDEIYIMHPKKETSAIELNTHDISFTHLIKPLDIKTISKTFLYH